ncbi:protein arginine methyltransferase NDUFAF7, mitochondrial-like isoform X2 [Pomacea canaliculata]|uniref:protein arginine methyltransferase NDUFAF7, mitochondrial-like isoform X2 n=1 Tax=Pomacea canaliculata TaxID=400727 RepID=UPI000D730A89|nr:protein arginine methyltransferase NDUFAF7, mitochondrial-like isoform X2 [Pomacea canaliculata]
MTFYVWGCPSAKMTNFSKCCLLRQVLRKALTFKFVSPGHCGLRHSFSTEEKNKLLKYLIAKIKLSGPITVAEYMKTVLTSPTSGYYMNRDVFGSKGDFITSPEISQMFGEMIGVWCVNEWSNLYAGQNIQVVELGPGRGTLSDDMLRFADIRDHVSLHLVEISPKLSQLQAERLTNKTTEATTAKMNNYGESINGETLGPYRQEISKYGQKVFWYRALEDVPSGLSFFIGHEFLDALPIHKFQKTEKGWCEVLVDVDDESDSSLRFVLSPGPTAASVSFLKVLENDDRCHIEVCPAAGQIVQEVSKRIQQHGGFALFADYGHSGEKGDTFRGFQKHELHDPLLEPGSADLTADVDFSYLKGCAKEVSVFGPITQQSFLMNMGIGVRLQMLLQKARQENWKTLLTGYDMLTNPEKMGQRFKFFAMIKPTSEDYVPAGFVMPEFLKSQR